MHAVIVFLILLCDIFYLITADVCSIRDHHRYGGPCYYNASTPITLGQYQEPTQGYVHGTGIHIGKMVKTYNGPMDQVTDWGPTGGYISSDAQYQLNIERSENVYTYNTCDNLPYGSVEEENLIANHMIGNREDPDLFVINIQPTANSLYVCTPIYEERCLTFSSGMTLYDLSITSKNTCIGLYLLSPAMSVCQLENDVQWTMTGYGLTELRGTVTLSAGKTTLHVKDSEYRHNGQFNQHVHSLPEETMVLDVTRTHVAFRTISNAFLAYNGTMYTEVVAYTANTNHPITNWESTRFDVILNSSIPCELYCYGTTYWFDFECVNHTMSSKSECRGGEFIPGTNVTDSECNPCIDSYDVSNVCTSYSFTSVSCTTGIFISGTNVSDTKCEACPMGKYLHEIECVNHTMSSKSECRGGEFVPGTNVTDSECNPCVDSYDVSNVCTPYSHTIETCTNGILAFGTNVSDNSCEACPTGKYIYENECRDCSELKNHFNNENCCSGRNQIEIPYSVYQPPRSVCQKILDAWRDDCDEQCYD